MPTYTYQAPCGHRWDEIRSSEGSQVSETPCPTCLEADRAQGELNSTRGLPPTYGRKIPSTFSVSFRGRGWTPTFYPNQRGNK